jgi:hypothetical protein
MPVDPFAAQRRLTSAVQRCPSSGEPRAGLWWCQDRVKTVRRDPDPAGIGRGGRSGQRMEARHLDDLARGLTCIVGAYPPRAPVLMSASTTGHRPQETYR